MRLQTNHGPIPHSCSMQLEDRRCGLEATALSVPLIAYAVRSLSCRSAIVQRYQNPQMPFQGPLILWSSIVLPSLHTSKSSWTQLIWLVIEHGDPMAPADVTHPIDTCYASQNNYRTQAC